MNKPTSNINVFAKLLNRLSTRHNAVRVTAHSEQTEDEEQVHIWINPWLGVDVVRHPVGRRPRRA